LSFLPFLNVATSSSILSSSHFLFDFLKAFFGDFCKTFRDNHILFFFGSKFIIFAVTSSHTFT
jgi:hypothetical protein